MQRQSYITLILLPPQWPALSRPSSTANTPAPGSPTAPRSPSTESPPALRKIRHIFPSFSTKRNPNVLVSRTDSAYPDLHGPVTASPLISPPTSSGASTHIVSSREISSSEDEPQKPSDQPNRGRRVQYEDLKLPLPKRDSPSRDRAGSVGVEGPCVSAFAILHLSESR